jgi:LmbE family N-acetylglucosaminyl deacetylase
MESAPPLDKKVVLAVQAHPDDLDFSSGGTVARFVKDGHDVYYLSATSGNKGTHDRNMTPERLTVIREAEQREAARVLGVKDVFFLRHNDGELEATLLLRGQICKVIRQVQANVLMTFDPWRPYQMHPDHRAIGTAALDGLIAARDHLFFPEQLRDGIDISRVHEVYLFGAAEPDVWIDISETIETKIAAAASHVSQLGGEPAQRAERQRERARQIGEPQSMAYAEAFKLLRLN